MKRFPVYNTKLSGKEKEYLSECVDSKWMSWRGPFVEKFENLFGNFIGTKHSLAVSSGTAALHLCLKSIGVATGDEVIVPDLAYVAVPNCVRYCDARPIFIDSNPEDWNIDVNQVEDHITDATRAIIAVHTLGAPCDMSRLMEISVKRKIPIIENACESLGGKSDGKYLGSIGTVGCFSFFANKTITTGEGGMVVSNDSILMERIRRLKTQAVDPDKTYWHNEIGYNYRMTNLGAAIGAAQMELLESILERKAEIHQLYIEKLGKYVQFQKVSRGHSHWMVAIYMDDIEAKDIAKKLDRMGVETRPLFYPASKMPIYFDEKGDYDRPVSRKISRCALMLPSYPDLSDDDVCEICSRVIKALE